MDGATARSAADAVLERLQSLDAWTQATTVGGYLSQGSELDTDGIASLAAGARKTYCLPVVTNGGLVFRVWAPGEPLVANRYGIGEPLANAATVDQIDLLLIPLVGWAADGTRLGMGGGYYDRFLTNTQNCIGLRLGLAFEAQHDERIRELREPWDQALDGVLTERAFYDFTK